MATTQAPGIMATTETPECDCCLYSDGLFLGPGCIVPATQMVAQTIVILILTGVICATCACIKRSSTRSRIYQIKIQVAIGTVLCLMVIGCTIAVGVCYGRNQNQPEACNCEDETPIHQVIVPCIMSTLYIIFLLIEFFVVPRFIPEVEGYCGSNENKVEDDNRIKSPIDEKKS